MTSPALPRCSRALAASVAVLLAVACGGSEDAPTTTYSDPDGNFSFSYPSTWAVEAVPEMNGVLLLAPDIEHDWQANMFFEWGLRHPSHSAERMLSDLATEISTRKPDYVYRSSGITTLGSGLEAGVLEYDHTNEGTPLIDREVLIPARDARMLFVTASTAKAAARKYQPIFDRVLNSVSF